MQQQHVVGIQETNQPARRTDVLWLILAMAGGGWLLAVTAGPPHLPPVWPSWSQVLATLQGSEVPLVAIAYLSTTAAWLLLGWLALQVVLSLLVALLELVTHGARWVRALQAVSQRITLPFVRRMVSGALLTVMLIHLAGRPSVGVVSAAPPPAATLVVPHMAPLYRLTPALLQPAPEPSESEAHLTTTTYTVQPGDTLWTISERFYGTGEEFGRIIAANVGREMPDGRTFPPEAVLRPGWVLAIPLPGTTLETVEDRRWYVVEPGDTLRGIAARFLGDEMRWPDIFALNNGRAKLADGRTLTNPDLIWPGLRLEIPADATAPAPPPVTPTPPVVPPTPAQPPVHPTPPPRASAIPPTPTPAGAAPTPTLPVPAMPTPVVPAPAPPLATVPPGAIPPAAPPSGPGTATTGGPPWIPVFLGGALAAGTAAGLGSLLVLRARRRRGLKVAPAAAGPIPLSATGFAGADFARQVAHRQGGGVAEPALVVAQAVLPVLAQQGCPSACILLALQERAGVTLTLTANPSERVQLLQAAGSLQRRLGCTVRIGVSQDRDAVIHLTRLPRDRLAQASREPQTVPVPPLLPAGITPAGATLYANWHVLGHVLVAGTLGEGTETVLAALVAAMAAHRSPTTFRLITITGRYSLPPELGGLPHQLHGIVDPADTTRTGTLLEDLRDELARRMRAAAQPGVPPHSDPELVLVLGELAELTANEPQAETLAFLATHGSEVGIRLLAATTGAETIDRVLLRGFTTRLVLEQLSEAASLQALGSPEAVQLGSGELLLRLAGRTPIRLRGFQVPPEQLTRLVAVMCQAAAPSGTAESTVPPADSTTTGVPEPSAAGTPPVELAGQAEPPETPAPVPPEPASTRVTDTPGTLQDAPSRTLTVDGTHTPDGDHPAIPAPGTVEPAGDHPAATMALDRRQSDPHAVRVPATNAVSAEGDTGQTHPAPIPPGMDAAKPVVPLAQAPPDAQTGAAAQTGFESASPPHNGYNAPPPEEQAGDNGMPHPVVSANGHDASHAPELGMRAGAASSESPAITGMAEPVRLMIQCFGRLVVTYDGRVLTASGEEETSYKAWELLAYLAAHPHGSVTRTALMAAMYPDSTPETADPRLRSTMKRLRDVLEQQVPALAPLRRQLIRSDPDGICRLHPGVLVSDVHQFLAHLDAAERLPEEEAIAELSQAVALYQGPLLCGEPSAGYGWVDDRAEDGITLWEHYADRYRQAVWKLARRYEHRGQPGQALPLYLQLFEEEPTHEQVVHKLVRCCDLLGDLATLQRIEQRHRQALLDDAEPGSLDSAPSPETVRLFQRIQARLQQQASAPAAGGTPKDGA